MIVKKVKYSEREIIPAIEIMDNIESILQRGNIIECYSPSVFGRENFTIEIENDSVVYLLNDKGQNIEKIVHIKSEVELVEEMKLREQLKGDTENKGMITAVCVTGGNI